MSKGERQVCIGSCSIALTPALLLQHAGLRESRSKRSHVEKQAVESLGLPASIHFNPLFASPVAQPPTDSGAQAAQAKVETKEAEPTPLTVPSQAAPAPSTSTPKAPSASSEPASSVPKSTSAAKTESSTPITNSLNDIVEKFISNQQGLNNMTEEQAAKLRGLKSEDAVRHYPAQTRNCLMPARQRGWPTYSRYTRGHGWKCHRRSTHIKSQRGRTARGAYFGRLLDA